MPTPEQWLEAERRGLLDDKKKAILQEARKRGMMPASGVIPGNAENAPRRSAVTPPLYIPDGQGGEIGLQGEDRQIEIARGIKQGNTEKAAEEKRLSERGYGERALDTAVFAADMPVRMATRGDYGLEDIARLGSDRLANSIGRSTGDFAKANSGALEAAAAVGDVAAGIPVLNTMGMPLRTSMREALRAGLASPRGTLASAVRGVGETLEGVSRDPRQAVRNMVTGAGDDITAINARPITNADRNLGARAGQNMQSYADNIQPRQSRIPQNPNQSTAPQNIQTVPEKLADIQAFRELELQPFAPATGSKGTARIGRTIEEAPLIGGTVKSPKTNVELGLAKTQADMARQLGAEGGEEGAGAMLQRGLERYRGAGIDELEPSVLRNEPGLQGSPVGPSGPVRPQGIEPYQPVKASETMSAPAAARASPTTQEGVAIRAARTAGGGGTATTNRGQPVTNARPLNQIGLRRTNAEDLSDAELGRVVRTPARETSLASRAEALYESAERKIPELKRSDGSVNPNQIPTVNLGNAMRGIVGEVGSQISGQNTIRGRLADMLMNGRANTLYSDLRGIRTEIGRALGNFGKFDVGLDRTQLNRAYAAATQDMELGLRDIANRAWRDTQLPAGNSAKIDVSQARRADAALYEFRRADRYFRQGIARLDKVMNVMGAKTPNEAARKIATALKEGTANPQMLRSIAGILRPNELNALRGHVIENLGRRRAGAKEAESVFNVNHVATDFHAIMDGPGKEFMMRGLPEDVAKKLNNFMRAVNRMKYYESTKNFSGSAYTGAGLAVLFSPDVLATAATTLGGGAIMGKLLTSRSYLNWQEALLKAQLKAGNTATANAKILGQYVKRLPALAKASKLTDPDLSAALQAYSIGLEQAIGGDQKEKARIAGP